MVIDNQIGIFLGSVILLFGLCMKPMTDHYAFVVVVEIISYLVINYLHMLRVNKISMADALKNRD
ncbi:hypothetical protein CLORY_31960 [Clostridium oryzae]|uniref:Uncharacterized protein n=1 Tax=Clostridium oryzae TaxID=1450648 RepID=A0A1V4II17_9CLOT|nr:hypothetical protein CLORY_31960 [Clostridium oryzae]